MNPANALTGSFEGQLLVAAPQMPDQRFRHTVIYMCTHTPEAAIGLVVNKLIEQLAFPDLLKQLGVEAVGSGKEIRVHFGGPVEPGRGFVLHTPEYHVDGTLMVGGGMALTGTTDILRDMALDRGPERSLLALGYAGWGPGQLDRELQDNGWLVVPADRELVFDTAIEEKWPMALRKLRVDPGALSQDIGHA